MSYRFASAISSLATMIFALALSACGNGDEVQPANTPASSAAPSAPAGPGTPPGGGKTATSAITDVVLESTASTEQGDIALSFGQVFTKGEVQPATVLWGVRGNAAAVPLQMDVKATHADGSVRHAVLSAVLPTLAGHESQRLTLTKGTTAHTGTAPAVRALLDAGFKAALNVNVGGQTYRASADELLGRGIHTTWLSGPVVAEWLVDAPLRSATGEAHPHLSARFAVRAYAGMATARVDVTVENNWAYEPGPRNFTYDAEVSVGDNPVFSQAAITHFHHARWRKIFWWGKEPRVHLRHNAAYLMASGALPNYDRSIDIPESTLTGLANRWSSSDTRPMGAGLVVSYMPTTGGRPDIGLLPGWSASYLLSMAPGAKMASLGTGDLAGSWPIHFRDKTTGRPVSIETYPYATTYPANASKDTVNPATQKSESFVACTVDCTTPYHPDAAHQPSMAYLPYLVTGDAYYLDELHFWALWNMYQQVPAYRDLAKGLVHRNQVRAQAWALRTLAHAAYITPDSDTLKPLLDRLLSNNLDWYNTAYTNNASPGNSLGFITEYSIGYDSGTGMAPWMDDFFTSVVGHVAELGYTQAQPLLAWKIKFPISRMLGPDFCWLLGANYSLPVRDSATSPIYTNIGQVHKAIKPAELTALECAGSAMATQLGLKPGEMPGYSSSTHGMPSNMQPALAYAADWGGASGAAAWRIFSGRSVKPNYADSPQFAIVPR